MWSAPAKWATVLHTLQQRRASMSPQTSASRRARQGEVHDREEPRPDGEEGANLESDAAAALRRIPVLYRMAVNSRAHSSSSRRQRKTWISSTRSSRASRRWLDEHHPRHQHLVHLHHVHRLKVESDPENVMGMHFMNPVPVMKLVELIRGLQTSDDLRPSKPRRRRWVRPPSSRGTSQDSS